VEVGQISNTTTLFHILAAEAVKHQIFNCFAGLAIEVNRTVVIARNTTKKLVQIVVKEHHLKVNQVLHQVLDNVLVQPKKELVAEIKRPVLVGDVIYINNKKNSL
jgi:hypothetical protein